MDGMSGVELLSALGRNHPQTRVVLITGFGTIELAVEAMRRGAVHFITKPFDNDEVLQTIVRYGQEAVIREKASRLKPPPGEGAPLIIAEDPRMKAVLELVRKVAPTPMSVLIQGESGSGKELIARAIHDQSEMRERPFLAVNSAALPDTLLESELFGHRKGAFTGADRNREGIFSRAGAAPCSSTRSPSCPRLSRASCCECSRRRPSFPWARRRRAGGFPPRRGHQPRSDHAHRRREFREDLFYRLRVVTVDLPPLRERPQDIVPWPRTSWPSTRIRSRRTRTARPSFPPRRSRS